MTLAIFHIKTATKKFAKSVRRRTTFPFRSKAAYVLVPSHLLDDPFHIPICYGRSSLPAATVATCFPSPRKSLNYVNTQAVCPAPEQLPDHELTVKLVVPTVQPQPLLMTRTFQHPDGSRYSCTLESDPEEEELYVRARELVNKDTEGQQFPDRSPVFAEPRAELDLPVVRSLCWQAKTVQHPDDLKRSCTVFKGLKEENQFAEVEQPVTDYADQQRLDRSPVPAETQSGLAPPTTQSQRLPIKTTRYPDGLPYPCGIQSDAKEEKLYAEIQQIFEQVGAKGLKDQQRPDCRLNLPTAKPRTRVTLPVVPAQPALSTRTYQHSDGLPYSCSVEIDSEEDKLYAELERILRLAVTRACHEDSQMKLDNATTSVRLSSAV